MRSIRFIALTSFILCGCGDAYGANTNGSNNNNTKTTQKEAEKTSKAVYKAMDFKHLLGMKGFSDDLLNMHFKLYEGYVKNTNQLQEDLANLVSTGKDRSPEYAGLKRMFGWEFDGMRLHEYYFGNLGGDGKLKNDSQLYKLLEEQFGSFDNWKKDFIATGMMRGIGWAILYEDSQTGRLVNTWINEHDLGHLAGSKPLLIMDVFEHAYITQYALNRDKYINAFFDNINWSVVEKRISVKGQ